jgi:hypothetical protein
MIPFDPWIFNIMEYGLVVFLHHKYVEVYGEKKFRVGKLLVIIDTYLGKCC